MRRVAIVTDGTSTTGISIASALADQGLTVVACGTQALQAGATLESDPRILLRHVDRRDHDGCIAEVAAIEAQLGPVAVLVNKTASPRGASFATMTPAIWREALASGLGGIFNMVRAVWPGMVARQFGRIVNFGSIDGQRGLGGSVHISAAKSGVHGFTKALAKEGGRSGITVNMLAIGHLAGDTTPEETVATIPVGRLGRPDEIARAVVFLCSDKAGYVTGSTLSINGGEHMF